MKIYSEGVEWTSVPQIRSRRASFFDRLVGINISKNKERILVEPIYQAVLSFEKQGDIVFITIGWDEPVLVIILMPSWPFVMFVRPGGYKLEEASEQTRKTF